jgi:hypothetical protein
MRGSRFACLPILLVAAGLASAQVVSPVEISGPEMRALRQSSMSQLKLAAQNIAGHHFDFPFYFSPQTRPEREATAARRPALHSLRTLQRSHRAGDYRQLLRCTLGREVKLFGSRAPTRSTKPVFAGMRGNTLWTSRWITHVRRRRHEV